MTSKRSRVPEHLDTISIIHRGPSSSNHEHTNCRKCRPLGRPSSGGTIFSIPSSMAKLRAPVNAGEVDEATNCAPWKPSSESGVHLWLTRDRSSRRGNERMRLRTCEDERMADTKRSDLSVGENLWNGARGIFEPSRLLSTLNRVTRESHQQNCEILFFLLFSGFLAYSRLFCHFLLIFQLL
jgi:hypothetical protein